MNILPFTEEKYFTDVIKLKILRWRDCPGLSSGSNVIVRVPMKQKLEGQCHGKRYIMEAKE